MSDRETLITDVEAAAHDFARKLQAALDGGVGPAVLVPTLMKVMEDEGLEVPALLGGLMGS